MIKIPIPPIPEQEKITAILDKFDILTHSISEGLPHEIALRRKQYEYYREQLLAFPRLPEKAACTFSGSPIRTSNRLTPDTAKDDS